MHVQEVLVLPTIIANTIRAWVQQSYIAYMLVCPHALSETRRPLKEGGALEEDST